jgi:hypothetical protein
LKKCQTITRPGWYSQHLRACIGHFFYFSYKDRGGSGIIKAE